MDRVAFCFQVSGNIDSGDLGDLGDLGDAVSQPAVVAVVGPLEVDRQNL
ncbi:hypothetical protein [Pseudarthrobacter sp. MM222]|nr:hypothetical protein [Pseudarthrobacter sp. MM222]CAI3794030.1 hypothetical protein NKCBBBOE_00956 [Pseudarthrobacter sp. MM222]